MSCASSLLCARMQFLEESYPQICLVSLMHSEKTRTRLEGLIKTRILGLLIIHSKVGYCQNSSPSCDFTATFLSGLTARIKFPSRSVNINSTGCGWLVSRGNLNYWKMLSKTKKLLAWLRSSRILFPTLRSTKGGGIIRQSIRKKKREGFSSTSQSTYFWSSTTCMLS